MRHKKIIEEVTHEREAAKKESIIDGQPMYQPWLGKGKKRPVIRFWHTFLGLVSGIQLAVGWRAALKEEGYLIDMAAGRVGKSAAFAEEQLGVCGQFLSSFFVSSCMAFYEIYDEHGRGRRSVWQNKLKVLLIWRPSGLGVGWLSVHNAMMMGREDWIWDVGVCVRERENRQKGPCFAFRWLALELLLLCICYRLALHDATFIVRRLLRVHSGSEEERHPRLRWFRPRTPSYSTYSPILPVSNQPSSLTPSHPIVSPPESPPTPSALPANTPP